MRLVLGAILALGLVLLGYAGISVMKSLDGDEPGTASATDPYESVEVTEMMYDARWSYAAETGFEGVITVSAENLLETAERNETDQNENDSGASFLIDYPTAFAGALSFHRIDQKLALRDHFDSRQASGLEHLSCFEMDSGLSLTSDRNLQEVMENYRACRVTSTSSDTPFHAVVGYLEPAKNQQPVDKPIERCAAEANVWLDRFAFPETRYAICMIVLDESQNSADLVLFERVGGDLVVRSAKSAAAGTKFSFRDNPARPSWNLTRFDHFQTWKHDEESVNPTFYSELPAIAKLIIERSQEKDLAPRFAVENVAQTETSIRITLRSLSDARVGDHTKRGSRVRNAVRDLLCGDPKLAAFLDLQQLDTVLGVRLIGEDGSIMMEGRHTETPCNSFRE